MVCAYMCAVFVCGTCMYRVQAHGHVYGVVIFIWYIYYVSLCGVFICACGMCVLWVCVFVGMWYISVCDMHICDMCVCIYVPQLLKA